MTVCVAGTDGDEGDRRPDRVEEGRGRRRSRAVMRDLEDVDVREAAPDERRVEILLEIPHQQEPSRARLPEQHHGCVVDRLAVRERPVRDGAGVRPEHPERELVERQPVAGGEQIVGRATGRKDRRPRPRAGSFAGQAGLVDMPDAVAPQDRDQPRDVVLVGMGQHEQVDPVIPRRQPLIERDQQAVRVGAAIHDQPSAAPTLDEDRVTLPDVESDDPRDAVGSMGDDDPEADDRASKCDPGNARGEMSPRGSTRDATSRLDRFPSGPWQLPDPSSRSRAQPRDRPIAPARDRDDRQERHQCGHQVPRGIELEAGEREARSGSHGCHHRRVDRPGRQAHECRHDPRQAEPCQHAHDERDRSRGHRWRDERHDDQVHGRRHERQPPEIEEHDRRCRTLCRERDAEDLREPASRPARGGSREARAERRAPREDARRREHRQAEARVVDVSGIEEEQPGHGPSERDRRRPRSAELASEERDAGHHPGTHD